MKQKLSMVNKQDLLYKLQKYCTRNKKGRPGMQGHYMFYNIDGFLKKKNETYTSTYTAMHLFVCAHLVYLHVYIYK